MDRVATNGHPADNRLRRHKKSCFFPKLSQSFSGISDIYRITSLLITSLLVTGCDVPFSVLDPAGPSADSARWLWWGMFSFFTLVFVLVVALWLYAIHRPQRNTAHPTDGSGDRRIQKFLLIGGGIILPGVTVIILLVFGIPAGHRMLPLPLASGEALRIDVTGHQWWWEVSYPGTDITLENEIHIPVGVPVDFHLSTADVIHAFWVPRLGGKLDTIPGRVNILRLQADEAGVYRGQCAEFCGLHHAHMQFTVEAHSPENYARWQAETRARQAADAGDSGND